MFSQDFPSDRIIRDLGMYSHPPFVPNLNFPQNYNQLLPDIIVVTINTIITNSRKNNLRIYCFNLLSENNFQNQDFVDLLNIIMSLTVVNVEARNMDINSAVNTAIEDGYSYFVCKITKDNRNLHQYVNREIEQDILLSIRELEESMNLLNRILSNNYRQPMNSFSNSYNNNTFDNRSFGSRYSDQNSRFTNQRTGYLSTGYQMSGSDRATNQGGKFDIRQNKPPTINAKPHVSSDIIKTHKDKGTEMKHKILEGNDMNGNTFFGVDLDISSILAKKKEITLNNLTETENEKNILSFLTSTTLEDILLTTKVKHIQILDKNPNIQTFRSYGLICEPIINNNHDAHKDISEILGYSEKTSAGIDLKNIAFKFRSLLDNYKNNIEIDKAYIVDSIKSISHINNVLTELINNFLKESLNDIGSIDSFMDDIFDLDRMLSIKAKEVSQEWGHFCSNVISSLTHKLEDGNYEVTVENIFMDDVKKDTILLTKIVTITSLNMNYIQFGCLVDKNNSVIVDPSKTPNIYEMIEGIFDMKDSEHNSLEDFIILNDGVHLQIYKDCLNNQYKLKRIK